MLNLDDQAVLAGHPTPSARDWKSGASIEELTNARPLSETCLVAGYPTPKVQAGKYQYSRGDHEKPSLNLSGVVDLTGYQTPCSQDGPNGGPSQGADRLPALVYTCGHGTSSVWFPARTAKSDGLRWALNPEFSGWLMGYPKAWIRAAMVGLSRKASSRTASRSCAGSGTRSSRK